MTNKGNAIKELVEKVNKTEVLSLYELGEKHIDLFCEVLKSTNAIDICNICGLIQNDDLFGDWSEDKIIRLCKKFDSSGDVQIKCWRFYEFVFLIRDKIYPKLKWKIIKNSYDFNRLDERSIREIFDSIPEKHKKSSSKLQLYDQSLYINIRDIEDEHKQMNIYNYLGFKVCKRKKTNIVEEIQKIINVSNKKISEKEIKNKIKGFKTSHQRIIYNILRLKHLTNHTKNITDHADVEPKYNSFVTTLNDVETMIRVLGIKNYDDLKQNFPSLENLIDRKNWLPNLFPEKSSKPES